MSEVPPHNVDSYNKETKRNSAPSAPLGLSQLTSKSLVGAPTFFAGAPSAPGALPSAPEGAIIVLL